MARTRPPRLLSDAGLARAAGADDEAFAELVRRHGARMRRHCERVAGRDLADDAFQHALTNAHRALRAGAEARDLRPWLMGIAHHAALDALRRAAPAWQELDETVEGAAPPPAVLARREELRRVVDALGRLPERQRRALVLRECEGRSWEEIARELDTGESAVRQLLFRARDQLRAGFAAVLVPFWLLRPASARAATARLVASKAGAAVTVAALGTGTAVVVAHHGTHTGEGRAAVAAGTPTRHGRDTAAPIAVVATDPTPAPKRHTPAHVAQHRRTAHRHGAASSTAPTAKAAPRSPSPPAPASSDDPRPQRHDDAPTKPASTTSSSQTVTSPPAPQATTTPASPDPVPPATTATTTDAPSASGATGTTPAPTATPAPAPIGSVASYSQSPGFGGPLEIAIDGTGSVNAYFGELTTLRCHRVQDGAELGVEDCDKSRLVPGAEVARAEHAVNGSGHDVWTVVELIVPA